VKQRGEGECRAVYSSVKQWRGAMWKGVEQSGAMWNNIEQCEAVYGAMWSLIVAMWSMVEQSMKHSGAVRSRVGQYRAARRSVE
jgi:hypothetical protein